jgi:hypothetical protein
MPRTTHNGRNGQKRVVSVNGRRTVSLNGRLVEDMIAAAGPNTRIPMLAQMDSLTSAAILPANLQLDKVYRDSWMGRKGPEKYKQARELAESDTFLSAILYLKELFFNDRFTFAGLAMPFAMLPRIAKPDGLAKWLLDTKYDFGRVVNDVWQEWLRCDNVVVFWNKPSGKDMLPTLTVLDCEICEYSNAFGIETLKLKFPKVTLDAKAKADLLQKGLDQRYIDAITSGKPMQVDPEKDERFRVLTRAKLGKGLASPRIGGVLQSLSTMELLGLGDWAAAWMMKKVTRLVTKGHEIRNGPLAGRPTHFIKKKEADAIAANLQGKDGAHDTVANFDIKMTFPSLDPKYFDAQKMEGTLRRIEAWAGPIMLMLREGQVSPYALEMFGAEGRKQRELVGGFLQDIFNSEDFIGEHEAPPQPLVCRWNRNSFTSSKILLQMIQLGYNNGIMSPQTSREDLDLNDEEESARQEAAGKNRQGYTPPFEAKQGIVGKGGRPSDSPGQPGANDGGES